MIGWTFRTLDANCASGLRESFRACLVRQDIDESDLFIAELIVGELIGNVVRHAPGYIDASYEQAGSTLTLRVKDSGCGYDPRVAFPGALAENGRGLPLIRALGGKLSVAPGDPGSCTTVSIRLRRPLANGSRRVMAVAS
jgi:anti-sigma regulatory factor (Ser/Thr protein kinase)